MQGTTTNGKCLLPFKTGAFLAGAPVQPVILKYGPDRVSPAWDSVTAVWHVILMLANPFHSVTARQVELCLCLAPMCVPALRWLGPLLFAGKQSFKPEFCFVTSLSFGK